MKMATNEIQNYVTKLEEAGLKSDSNAKEVEQNLHHYVVHTVIEDGKYNETFAGFPKAFDNCCEDTTADGHDEVYSMFFLEDCTVEEAEEIVSWLKANKNWESYSRSSNIKMSAEEIQNYASQIEEAGLKRDTNSDVAGLHHYVVQTTYMIEDQDAVIDGMPNAFEACFDNENDKTGECEDVSMFYLEDCSVTDAATIVSWLKANKNWKTYVAD